MQVVHSAPILMRSPSPDLARPSSTCEGQPLNTVPTVSKHGMSEPPDRRTGQLQTCGRNQGV
jgi:hypothetical protein